MHPISRRACAWLCVLCVLSAAPGLVRADLLVPAGARVQVGSGTLDAGGTDMAISGEVQVQSGTLRGLRNVDIAPGGTLDNGSGQIALSGDWNPAGAFVAGSGRVDFIDGLGPATATINGDSTFFDLAFTSTTGKNFRFAVGSVQTIVGQLAILGTQASPVQFRSTAAGQVASINLLPGGTQNILHVGVSDVHAIGQPLAPEQNNEGGSGNDVGWFGNVALGTVRDLPSASPWSLALLILSLAVLALRRGSRVPSASGVRE